MLAELSDTKPALWDWDELYVHAIQRALVGRKNDELLSLLESARPLHPALGPALADVIRSQRDQARGRGKALTQRQDAMIREVVNEEFSQRLGRKDTIDWLAATIGVSVDSIKESLQRTEPGR